MPQQYFYSHPLFTRLRTISIAVLLLSSACHHKNATVPGGSDSAAVHRSDSTQKNFFPVADFIRSEIRYVDSTPLAILKYSTRDNHTDSAFIQGAEFHRLAQEFLLPELAKENFENNYSENSFIDGTGGYLTFTYSPRDKNKDLPLQRVDVLAIPSSDEGSSPNQVKSIYLQTATSSADTLIVKKMLWVAKKSMLIMTSLQLRDKAPVIRQLKVIWDSSPSQ